VWTAHAPMAASWMMPAAVVWAASHGSAGGGPFPPMVEMMRHRRGRARRHRQRADHLDQTYTLNQERAGSRARQEMMKAWSSSLP